MHSSFGIDGDDLDSDWLLDSGASHHFTFDGHQVHNASTCNGKEGVLNCNGQKLPIKSIGSGSFLLAITIIYLYAHYYILQMLQPIFYQSIDYMLVMVSWNFILMFFYVKDQSTKKGVLQGTSEACLHTVHEVSHNHTPVNHIDHSHPPLAMTTSVPLTSCHKRLGHPSHAILSKILNQYISTSLPVSNKNGHFWK